MRTIDQRPEPSSIIWSTPFLMELDAERREEIATMSKLVELEPGDVLFREGDAANGFYLLESGSVEVLKHESTKGVDHRIATLESGDSIGEMAVIDDTPRAATIRAIAPSRAYYIPVNRFTAEDRRASPLGTMLRLGFSEVLASRLRGLNDVTVRHLRDQLAEANARAALGSLLITIIVLFAGFVFTVAMASRMVQTMSDTLLLNIPIIVIFASALFVVLWRSGFPMKMYGLHLEHAGHYAWQAVLWTSPLLVLIVLVKWWLLQTNPEMAGQPLFEGGDKLRESFTFTVVSIIGYSVLAPVQEFITRSGIQSALAVHLAGKHAKINAYLIACLMFSFSHIHLAPIMVLMVTPLGLFWGWIFMRQQSLVGVSVSHILVGVFALYVVGFSGVIPS